MSQPEEIAAILRRQHGVIGYAQARAAGMTKEAIRWQGADGRWIRARRGVYRLASATLTWHVRAHTGTRVATRKKLEVVTRDNLPVTTAASTVLDLTDIPGTTWREGVHTVARWIHRTPLTAAQLSTALEARARHQHRAVIITALRPIVEGAESGLEVSSLDGVILAHGLPQPRLQVPVEPGVSRARRDAVWDKWAVVLELDGLLGHDGESLFTDRSRCRRRRAVSRRRRRARPRRAGRGWRRRGPGSAASRPAERRPGRSRPGRAAPRRPPRATAASGRGWR